MTTATTPSGSAAGGSAAPQRAGLVLVTLNLVAVVANPGRAAVLLPVITRDRRQYRAEWHHQLANAVMFAMPTETSEPQRCRSRGSSRPPAWAATPHRPHTASGDSR
jgi:hypothetical protein